MKRGQIIITMSKLIRDKNKKVFRKIKSNFVVKLPHETKGYISTKKEKKSPSSWIFKENGDSSRSKDN